jgi:hypothetical protein
MTSFDHHHDIVHIEPDQEELSSQDSKVTPPEIAPNPAPSYANLPLDTSDSFDPPFAPTSTNLVEAGVICEVKDLFKGKENCACCITWSTEPQKKLSAKTSTDTGGFAVLARKTEGHGDFGRELKLHSIVIQSPLIRDVVDGVLKGYPGLTSELASLTVESPFGCFYHRWTELKVAFEASTGDVAKHMGWSQSLKVLRKLWAIS